MQPLFWWQQEVEDSVNGHPVVPGFQKAKIDSCWYEVWLKSENLTQQKHSH